MPVICTGTVSNNLAGNLLTFTDTGTGYGSIVSRTLVIKDAIGGILTTISMSTALTATYAISADAYFEFDLTVIDNAGTHICTVTYVAIGFYTAAYLAQFVSTNCGCSYDNCNLDTAELLLNAALRFNIGGNGVAANSCIIGANIYVNMSPVVQYA